MNSKNICTSAHPKSAHLHIFTAMNILLLGSGGRESAFAWKISQSPKCEQLFIAPGNAGTGQYGTNVNLKVTDFAGIKAFAIANSINLVLVGPEEPLVKGIHDFFLTDDALKHIPVVGPQSEGAQLEGSKDFSKQFMQRHNIPAAAWGSCEAFIHIPSYPRHTPF